MLGFITAFTFFGVLGFITAFTFPKLRATVIYGGTNFRLLTPQRKGSQNTKVNPAQSSAQTCSRFNQRLLYLKYSARDENGPATGFQRSGNYNESHRFAERINKQRHDAEVRPKFLANSATATSWRINKQRHLAEVCPKFLANSATATSWRINEQRHIAGASPKFLANSATAQTWRFSYLSRLKTFPPTTRLVNARKNGITFLYFDDMCGSGTHS